MRPLAGYAAAYIVGAVVHFLAGAIILSVNGWCGVGWGTFEHYFANFLSPAMLLTTNVVLALALPIPWHRIALAVWTGNVSYALANDAFYASHTLVDVEPFMERLAYMSSILLNCFVGAWIGGLVRQRLPSRRHNADSAT